MDHGLVEHLDEHPPSPGLGQKMPRAHRRHAVGQRREGRVVRDRLHHPSLVRRDGGGVGGRIFLDQRHPQDGVGTVHEEKLHAEHERGALHAHGGRAAAQFGGHGVHGRDHFHGGGGAMGGKDELGEFGVVGGEDDAALRVVFGHEDIPVGEGVLGARPDGEGGDLGDLFHQACLFGGDGLHVGKVGTLHFVVEGGAAVGCEAVAGSIGDLQLCEPCDDAAFEQRQVDVVAQFFGEVGGGRVELPGILGLLHGHHHGIVYQASVPGHDGEVELGNGGGSVGVGVFLTGIDGGQGSFVAEDAVDLCGSCHGHHEGPVHIWIVHGQADHPELPLDPDIPGL
mmetsp:Transcript_41455/g.81255  ORF Transcript_41455/g.81255 Transcript_41455/m.81255 type:complete len:339 (-) Transcript_41455:1178-2194(-)